jgi:hypothetical protein
MEHLRICVGAPGSLEELFILFPASPWNVSTFCINSKRIFLRKFLSRDFLLHGDVKNNLFLDMKEHVCYDLILAGLR